MDLVCCKADIAAEERDDQLLSRVQHILLPHMASVCGWMDSSAHAVGMFVFRRCGLLPHSWPQPISMRTDHEAAHPSGMVASASRPQLGATDWLAENRIKSGLDSYIHQDARAT